ncbi:MAG: tRNA uridine-5-carboxymethylaminomethyl(34) synthesis GTPase MnmE [Hydrogenophaga sp.]|uniref:tRNA uridine-5-carboxymethylaminomethyl(34) synthesis GTPase MnmE n=1 Tax=Hydrogenophaga sp. TaxID=1904254 RepID=UPI002730ED14|nr:tRNA uridine-5-carboxymethylaminomethyl(34) synthesis GTPase MnmE [Hydrogenophaga sp.]MDP2166616.1 tRNA uridine-5-carboxymethylaminomethyl(34) synthesis GTPase MnmE [Hydrogenophaga sp.]
MNTGDTIAAIATPPGRGGIGIVRVSGPCAHQIGKAVMQCGSDLPVRQALFSPFHAQDGSQIDEGLVIHFKAPNSFTGEDVVELQGHGGPVVMDMLLRRVVELGARLARPGEFSERAFLNDKLDLAQAEAIADLIDAGSAEAARSAVRSLSGVFSQKIHELTEALIRLRIHVEAAIDFPEEEIDFLGDGRIEADLRTVQATLDAVMQQTRQGTLLREGMRVVIAGRPNAGKSSLLNALAGFDAAIVTDIAGTTRDVLREHIQIDGMPVHIIDTAGLRETDDVVEREGVRRALREIDAADRVLLVYDASIEADPFTIAATFFTPVPGPEKLLLIANKCDLLGADKASLVRRQDSQGRSYTEIGLSARAGQGLEILRAQMKAARGFQSDGASLFTARRRHLDALERARGSLAAGLEQLLSHAAGELLAEDLRHAQEALSEITGEFSSDDLLGRIFSSFCIGK